MAVTSYGSVADTGDLSDLESARGARVDHNHTDDKSVRRQLIMTIPIFLVYRTQNRLRVPVVKGITVGNHTLWVGSVF